MARAEAGMHDLDHYEATRLIEAVREVAEGTVSLQQIIDGLAGPSDSFEGMAGTERTRSTANNDPGTTRDHGEGGGTGRTAEMDRPGRAQSQRFGPRGPTGRTEPPRPRSDETKPSERPDEYRNAPNWR